MALENPGFVLKNNNRNQQGQRHLVILGIGLYVWSSLLFSSYDVSLSLLHGTVELRQEDQQQQHIHTHTTASMASATVTKSQSENGSVATATETEISKRMNISNPNGKTVTTTAITNTLDNDNDNEDDDQDEYDNQDYDENDNDKENDNYDDNKDDHSEESESDNDISEENNDEYYDSNDDYTDDNNIKNTTLINNKSPLLAGDQPIPSHVLDPTLPDFPYNLSCCRNGHSNNNETWNVSIVLVYHVGMIGNWKQVVQDQMRTIAACGLGSLVDSFFVSFATPPRKYEKRKTETAEKRLLDVLASSDFHKRPDQLQRSLSVPWERPAMEMARLHCIERQQQQQQSPMAVNESGQLINTTSVKNSDRRPTVVFYLHSKGVSKYSHGWKEELLHVRARARIYTYAHSLYWRKYMEYFTIERPHLCLDRILPTIPRPVVVASAANDSSSTTYNKSRAFNSTLLLSKSMPRSPDTGVACGVEYEATTSNRHFAGNFWAASCDYIARTRSAIIGTDYTDAEMWIGASTPEQKEQQDNFVGLAKYKGPTGLYRHIMLPETYAFSEADEATKHANVKFPLVFR